MFFFSSRRRHTRYWRDWSSDVCSSDLHHRRVRGLRAALDPDLLALAGGVLADVDHAPRLQEVPGHLDGLVQPPPRVAPEVEDEAAGAGGPGLLERLPELLGAVVREGGKAHVGHIAAGDQNPRRRRRLDLGTLEVEHALLAVAQYGQLHPGPLGTPDLLDDLREVLLTHALPVHGHHDVAGFHTGLVGRRPL